MRIFAIVLCLLLILIGCTVQFAETDLEETTMPTTSMDSEITRDETSSGRESGIIEVSYFGIGRADSILITTENYTLIIDTGERQHGEYIVRYLQDQDISTIDYLIITHFDRDHVGGAYLIINKLDVKNIIVPNYSRDTNHVIRFETAMENAGIEPIVLTETLRLTLDDADFIIDPSLLDYMHFPRQDLAYNSLDDEYYEDNDGEEAESGVLQPTSDDFSIAVSVTHGENNFLFTGDAWTIRLAELLENNEIMSIDYDFLHVPRHGRHNANSVEFIHAISPRYAVITGFHPENMSLYYPERSTDRRVIAALEHVGAEAFFTMSRGLHVRSNGVELAVSYKDFFDSFRY